MSVSVIDWDEGAFALAARELLHGHLPYTTFFDNKPIGSAILLAPVLGMFGESVEAVRVAGLIAVTCTGWCVYLIARSFAFRRVVNVSAAMLYVVFSTGLHGTATMTEILLAPFSTAAVLLLLRMVQVRGTAGRLSLAGLSGLLFGIAVSIKYVPVIPACCVSLICLIELVIQQRVSLIHAISGSVLFVSGVVLPTLAAILWSSAAGLLPMFWYANFSYVSRYVGHDDHVASNMMRALILVEDELWPLAVLTACALLPAVAVPLLRGARRFPTTILAAWLIAELAAAAAPMKFFPHYFLMILPPLCIFAALILWRGVTGLAMPRLAGRAMFTCVIAVCLLPMLHHVIAMGRALARPDVARQIGALARQTLQRDETVYVVNSDPVIYLISGTELPTRYAFPTHLIGSQRYLVPEPNHPEVQRILNGRPRLIVVDDSWTDPIKADQEARALIERTLMASYVAARTFQDDTTSVHVFVRRD
jgi:4-amino-4-deoxy-L-arabinose transferase-like glycosyltransferase